MHSNDLGYSVNCCHKTQSGQFRRSLSRFGVMIKSNKFDIITSLSYWLCQKRCQQPTAELSPAPNCELQINKNKHSRKAQ